MRSSNVVGGSRPAARGRFPRSLAAGAVAIVALGTAAGLWCGADAPRPAVHVDAPAAVLPPLAPSLGGLWSVLATFTVLGVAAIAFARKRRSACPGNGTLHLVDTLHLGGRRLVHLVRCGDRRYLIASSENDVRYLATLPCEPAECLAGAPLDDADVGDDDDADLDSADPVERVARGAGAAGESPFGAFLEFGRRR